VLANPGGAKVQYELSSLGTELLVHMIALWTWVVERSDAFRRARERFDRQ